MKKLIIVYKILAILFTLQFASFYTSVSRSDYDMARFINILFSTVVTTSCNNSYSAHIIHLL